MTRRPRVRDLSIEEIEEIGKDFKDDLQREANRCARRHDNEAAVAALEAIDYVDKFLYTLKLRAGSELRAFLARPARARPIRLSPRIINRK